MPRGPSIALQDSVLEQSSDEASRLEGSRHRWQCGWRCQLSFTLEMKGRSLGRRALEWS